MTNPKKTERARRLWTPKEIRRLVETARCGGNLRVLAEKLGRPYSAVKAKLVQVRGRSPELAESLRYKKPRSALTPADIARIHQLREQGVPVAKIAQAFGVTRAVIYNHLARNPEDTPRPLVKPRWTWAETLALFFLVKSGVPLTKAAKALNKTEAGALLYLRRQLLSARGLRRNPGLTSEELAVVSRWLDRGAKEAGGGQ